MRYAALAISLALLACLAGCSKHAPTPLRVFHADSLAWTDSRESLAPSSSTIARRWCGKFVCRRTKRPSPVRYTPAIGSHIAGGSRPTMRRYRSLRNSSAAARMSTATRCGRPLRSFQSSAAASPAEAIDTCAAVPTRNEDGSAGSSPVSDTRSSACGSPPPSDQTSRRISRQVVTAPPWRVREPGSILIERSTQGGAP